MYERISFKEKEDAFRMEIAFLTWVYGNCETN